MNNIIDGDSCSESEFNDKDGNQDHVEIVLSER
jgi:hypothetical protein